MLEFLVPFRHGEVLLVLTVLKPLAVASVCEDAQRMRLGVKYIFAERNEIVGAEQ